jgi:hypothetical protein
MKDPITARAAHILAQSSHLLIPLEDLYNALEDEGLMAWVNPEMFEYLIASDETFEIIEGLEALDMLTPLLRAELRIQGFLSGPLVMLHQWTAFPSLILEDLLTHLQDMSSALETAWQTRTPDDPVTEAELLNMLMMSDMLAREISGALHVYVESEENDAQDPRAGNGAANQQDTV